VRNLYYVLIVKACAMLTRSAKHPSRRAPRHADLATHPAARNAFPSQVDVTDGNLLGDTALGYDNMGCCGTPAIRRYW
jgi:hypothetical protein